MIIKDLSCKSTKKYVTGARGVNKNIHRVFNNRVKLHGMREIMGYQQVSVEEVCKRLLVWC